MQRNMRSACDDSRGFTTSNYSAKTSLGIKKSAFGRSVMFDRRELWARGHVRTLVEIVEQVPARWATRAPMLLDESTVGMLLLWTLVRWELRFPLTLLEEMGMDFQAFTRDLDQLLNQEKIKNTQGNVFSSAPGVDNQDAVRRLRKLTDLWLQRAEAESRRLGHAFVGAEHLLLALIACVQPSWSPIFTRFSIDYERLKELILQALQANLSKPDEIAIDAVLLPSSPWEFDRNVHGDRVPWGAAWDKPAVGIPRKFGIAILMMQVTLFAMVFSILKWINASPIFYGLCGVLVLGVALGQMFLFGGKYPRAASIWTGAILLPAEIGAVNLFSNLFFQQNYNFSFPDRLITTFLLMLCTVPLGAFMGYLAGGLTAGVVLILEWKNRQSPAPTEENL
jgi:hypothetical protein